MTSQDKPSILRILRATPEFLPAELVVAEELLDIYLNDPVTSGYYVLVAEVDSSVVGYVCYGPTPLTEGTWDVYWIAVAREKQGNGIGRALTLSAEEEIRKAGGRLIVIETSSKPSYDRTRRFYELQGYKVICQIPDYYAPGDDQVLYHKRLK